MVNRLRVWRVIKKLSQEALASLTGIPQPRLSEIETDLRKPTEAQQAVIAKALGVKVQSLWLKPRRRRQVQATKEARGIGGRE